MPPKIKTTDITIMNAALEVARREGIMAITAQSVSKELGTSVAPIFRVFSSVEELREATVTKANKYQLEYLQNYQTKYSNFLSYGLAYVSFAQNEPKLFEAIMKFDSPNLEEVRAMIKEKLSFVVSSAAKIAEISREDAMEIFFHVWVYTHGLANIASKNQSGLNEDETASLLQIQFQSLLKQFKG